MPPVPAYGFAAAAFLVGLGARFLIHPVLPPGFPYLTFFPAVILTCFVAGTRAGTLCAVLSGLAAWYWFIPPFDSFGLTSHTALALAFYVFIVGVDIAIIHAMRRAGERLKAAQQVSAELAERQSTLFAELQHRVANNLSFVSSLLLLQKAAVAADPASASGAFDDAIHRLEMMARLHRRLHDPAALDQPLGTYLDGLCDDVLKAAGASGVACRVTADDVRLDLRGLTSLSLILTELVTNSVKHAFKGRDHGVIEVDLKRLGPHRAALTVADDGPGMPRKVVPSLGLQIIQGLASQLDGELVLPEPGSSLTRVEFPA